MLCCVVIPEVRECTPEYSFVIGSCSLFFFFFYINNAFPPLRYDAQVVVHRGFVLGLIRFLHHRL